jgi:hypothetical protein
MVWKVRIVSSVGDWRDRRDGGVLSSRLGAFYARAAGALLIFMGAPTCRVLFTAARTTPPTRRSVIRLEPLLVGTGTQANKHSDRAAVFHFVLWPDANARRP